MATARKTTTAAKTATPKAPRKPRVPKPVVDLSTALAAFQRAKRANDTAQKQKAKADARAEETSAALTSAATVLKTYTADVDAALAQVKTDDEDANDVADTAGDDSYADEAEDDTDPLYHGGYGDDETDETHNG